MERDGKSFYVDKDGNKSDSYELLESPMKKKDEKSERKKKSVWLTLLFGQVLSIANAGTGAASTSLAERCNINNPTAQSGFLYFILSLCLFFLPQKTQLEEDERNIDTIHTSELVIASPQPILTRDYKSRFKIQAPWYYYAILAFMDLEANYLTYYAYRYTSFTSIALLASVSIPSAMFFSFLLLSKKYHIWHILGVCMCLVGFLMTFKSDMNTNSNESSNNEGASYSSPIKGDFLAFFGALLYGLNDTLAESCVKQFHPLEYLGMLGIFGCIISLIQISILEPSVYETMWHTMTSNDHENETCSVTQVSLLLLWNTLSLASYYIGAAFFLLNYDAALLDVSLLSTNIYAYAFVIFSNISKTPLHSIQYFLAMGFVMVGVSIYEMGHKFPNLTRRNVRIASYSEEENIGDRDIIYLSNDDKHSSFRYGSLFSKTIQT